MSPFEGPYIFFEKEEGELGVKCSFKQDAPKLIINILVTFFFKKKDKDFLKVLICDIRVKVVLEMKEHVISRDHFIKLKEDKITYFFSDFCKIESDKEKIHHRCSGGYSRNTKTR